MSHRVDPLFAIHASPESIEIAIREAEGTSTRYAKKASALRGLLDVRRAQIAAGTWPPKDDAAQPAACPGFEKEYQGVSDAKRRLANCKHCGQPRTAHPAT